MAGSAGGVAVRVSARAGDDRGMCDRLATRRSEIPCAHGSGDRGILVAVHASNEPIFTFGVDASGAGGTSTAEQITPEGRFEVNYLIHFKESSKRPR